MNVPAALSYPGPRPADAVQLLDGHAVSLGDPHQPPYVPSGGWCVPLVAYGALGSPGHLVARFGGHSDGMVLLPAEMAGARPVWAMGGRYTLAANLSGSVGAHLLLLPAGPFLPPALDLVEGRGAGFYELVRLLGARVTVTVGGTRFALECPVAYLGARLRQPADPTEVTPAHQVIPVGVPLDQVAPTPGERALQDRLAGR